MASFFAELKRRNVFKVGVAYAIMAWLLVQIIVAVETPLNLPEWMDTFIIILLIIGFPTTLIFAWIFELTPEGIKTTQSVGPNESITHVTGQKLNYTIIGLLSVAVLLMFVDNYILVEESDVTNTSMQSMESISLGAMDEIAPGDVVEPEEAEPARLPNSVAILPFENLSSDPENAYFAAGIHESTLSQVAKIRDLTVMARTSVMQYGNNPLPIPEIAEALNVETVMEGSVRYANDRVLITAQLIDGRTGAHIWSDEYVSDLTDIFSVQAEVAEQIALAMQVELIPEDRARIDSRPTESEEAYRYYLEAVSLPNPDSRPEYANAFIYSLERAIEEDPNFVDPYTQLSGYYTNIGEYELGRQYAEKAVELDPLSGKANLSLGYTYKYYFNLLDQARAYLNRGIELSPNDPWILALYCYRATDDTNDYDQVIRICERAVAIDPTNAAPHRRLAYALMRAGNYSDAINHFNEAIEINPVADHQPYLELAMAQYLNGDSDNARKNLDIAVNIMSTNSIYRIDYIAYLYGLLGDTAEAIKLVSQIINLTNESGIEGDENVGWGLLGTRYKERALDYWTKVINDYVDNNRPVSSGRISRFRDNYLNDPMLDEPEFLVLRRRLGFEG